MRESLRGRFWAKVDTSDMGGCWVWTGWVTRKRGRIGIDGKDELAHRVAWEMKNGPIPEELHVCHHCDNPTCVRVSHLFLGTHRDNMDDMLRKGRSVRGEKNHRSRLTEDSVREIRCLYAGGDYTLGELGEMFNVHQTTIFDAINKRSWKHI